MSGRMRAIVGMERMAVMRVMFRKKRHSAADVIAVHGTAAAVENEVGSKNDQNAIARLKRFVRVVAKPDAIDITFMRLVEEVAVLVIDVAAPPSASFDHPHIQDTGMNRGSANRAGELNL